VRCELPEQLYLVVAFFSSYYDYTPHHRHLIWEKIIKLLKSGKKFGVFVNESTGLGGAKNLGLR
jgi:hypothetical protein